MSFNESVLSDTLRQGTARRREKSSSLRTPPGNVPVTFALGCK